MYRAILWFSLCLALMANAWGCSASPSYASSDYSPAPAYYGESDSVIRAQHARPTSALAFNASEVRGGLAAEHRSSQDNASVPGPNGPVQRKFVRTANLTLEVDDEDDFKPTLIKARKIAEGLDGYVQQESTTSITVLVPTDQLDTALAQLEKLGEVTSRNVRIVDVTSQYVDMQIRINNLRKMRERLTELVAQSTDVSEILKIETELGRITSELERMEGQLRLMERNTTYATVYLSLEEEVTPGPLGWIFYGVAMGVKWLFVWD